MKGATIHEDRESHCRRRRRSARRSTRRCAGDRQGLRRGRHRGRSIAEGRKRGSVHRVQLGARITMPMFEIEQYELHTQTIRSVEMIGS